jgi:hypothetical protein
LGALGCFATRTSEPVLERLLDRDAGRVSLQARGLERAHRRAEGERLGRLRLCQHHEREQRGLAGAQRAAVTRQRLPCRDLGDGRGHGGRVVEFVHPQIVLHRPVEGVEQGIQAHGARDLPACRDGGLDALLRGAVGFRRARQARERPQAGVAGRGL